MIIVVNGLPICSANITKFVPALTGEMVAALVFLDNNLAFLASLVVQVLDKNIGLIVITVPFVNFHQTFFAELFLTCFTSQWTKINAIFLDDSLAVLLRTHFAEGVFDRQIKLVQFKVVFLNINGKFLEKFTICVYHFAALCAGAGYLLKLTYHIDAVLVEAGLAVI